MLIDGAVSGIDIQTPYFLPDKSLRRALVRAAQRGVRVRVIVPGPITDQRLVRLASRRMVRELLEAGVRIYEYQPTFMHAKVAVVDGQWSMFGSPNLNTRSRQLDEENVFGVLDETLARRLDDLFVADLTRSREITLDAWRRRNPLLKLLQFASKILDQQS
jgi:cardiolipin synthase